MCDNPEIKENKFDILQKKQYNESDNGIEYFAEQSYWERRKTRNAGSKRQT